jgi:hypothetical protein
MPPAGIAVGVPAKVQLAPVQQAQQLIVGSLVKLHSLVARTDLNGVIASVREPLNENQRVRVQLLNDTKKEIVSVKACNLERFE